MNENTSRQLNSFICKQEALILNEPDQENRVLLVAMWQGFLAGLQLTNVINNKEYDYYLQEIKEFLERVERYEKNKITNNADIIFNAYGYELQS